jgi:glucokinase
MILAGDIGGTSARLALCEKNAEGFETVAVDRFSSSAFPSLGAIVERFLSDKTNAQIERACFGVPGPVTGDVIRLANLPWTVETSAIKNLLQTEKVGFINDLEANAYGLNELAEKDVAVLNAGEPNPMGNAAIISAGTGLGEAGLHFEEGMNKLRPFASEGGHTDFAPRNELEIELLRFLISKFDHVSWERVVSGKGLQNIYEFLRQTKRAEESAWLKDEIAASDDLTAVISRNALAGKAAICEQTLDIFVSLYGAEAGNLALKMLATNGVFLGGGIAPKILPKLKEDCFLKSFQAKGRMQPLLEKIPVRVVLNDQAALLGAAHFAFYEIKD